MEHINNQEPPGTTQLVHESAATGNESLHLFPHPSADPNEPLNWSATRKFVNYSLVLIVTLLIFTSLSTQIIFWQLLAPDLGASLAQLNNAQSIQSAGLTTGCIFFIPFAIKYGRRPVYVLSTAVIFAISVWSARMTTVWELYVTNLILGLASAINEAIVGLSIADLFFVHQRATMNGFYLVSVLSGSFLTPMIAGIQVTQQGWRWSYYAQSIAAGIILLLFVFCYEESKYVPTLAGLEATRSRSNPDTLPKDTLKMTEQEVDTTAAAPKAERLDHSIPLKTWKQRHAMITRTDENLWTLSYRPLIVLFKFPAVAFAAVQYGAGLSWLVNMAVSVSINFSFPPYNFKPAAIGYMGLGPFVGNLIGSIYCGYFADKAVIWYAKRNKGWFEPEMRLYLLHLPSLSIGAGLIMFGITTAKGMHWIYPSVGGALFGFGLGSFGDVVLTYVIDSYRNITGESFVAIAVVRNVFGIVIGQVRTPWMVNMGIQNMFILQGVLATAICLLYIPMIYFGKKARVNSAGRYYKMSEQRF